MFGPGSLTWRVNGEAVLLLGGGRALILQVAHPGVAAGVAEFSDYRRDPWRRLYRTLDTTLAIVFGDPPSSRAAAERLRRVHQRVAGTDDRGEPYRALDPELLLWVHATLIDTSLTIYERYVKRLGPTEVDRYYEEMKDIGEAYSIPRDAMPADYTAFRRYWAAMLEGGLRITETTRDVADAILRPDLTPLAWPAVELIRQVTVGTLPAEVRDALGLSWGSARERMLGASQLMARRLMPLLPALAHRFPQARTGACAHLIKPLPRARRLKCEACRRSVDSKSLWMRMSGRRSTDTCCARSHQNPKRCSPNWRRSADARGRRSNIRLACRLGVPHEIR